jgi:hypothetical protein
MDSLHILSLGHWTSLARYILGLKARILNEILFRKPCKIMIYISTSLFLLVILFIGFLVVHIILIEYLNKRKNVFFFYYFFINCCVLAHLTIFFFFFVLIVVFLDRRPTSF